DAEAPTITPAEPLTVESTLGECHAILTIEPPLVLDNCGSWDAVGTRSDKNELTDPFPVGRTEITWRTGEMEATREEVVQLITVVDSEAPVIPAVQPIIRNNDQGVNGAFITIGDP